MDATVGLWILLFVAGMCAGAQNALAGGGSFVTLAILVLAGLEARAANITSTVALFPGQVSTGYAGRRLAAGADHLSFTALFVISLIGGLLGAVLLLATPPTFFAALVPWLVLLATGIFAWGSSVRNVPTGAVPLDRGRAAVAQLAIAIYGGYFGGGIGFLMLAALTIAGQSIRAASATKNVLAAAMNASAVAIFVFSRDVHWREAGILGLGAIVGGIIGAGLLSRLNEQWLRIGVIAIGAALSVGLFLRAG